MSKLSQEELKRKIRSKLKRGDILILGAGPSKRLIDELYLNFQEGIFGDRKNTHASMYLGKGKTIDAFPGKGVVETELKDVLKNRTHVTVLRSGLSQKKIKESLARAKKAIGKKEFSYKNIGGELFKGIGLSGLAKKIEEKKKVICSGLIAQSFKDLRVGKPGSGRNLVAPYDFRKSPDLKPVLEADIDLGGKYKVTEIFKRKSK
jgi:cell wall-associated NlpC family hydrolase